jgi:hypothetical protein
MSKEAIKSKVLDHFTIEVDAEDGKPSKVWKLCYRYRDIALIEETIQKDIKNIETWTKAFSSGKDIPVIVWGGLRKFNPEVTLDDVLDVLNPEAQAGLNSAIVELLFPGIHVAAEKAAKALEEKSPNVQTATQEQ